MAKQKSHPPAQNRRPDSGLIFVTRRVVRFGARWNILPFQWDDKTGLLVGRTKRSDRLWCIFTFWLDVVLRIGFTFYTFYGFWSGQFKLIHMMAHIYLTLTNILTVGFSTTILLRGNEMAAFINRILLMSDCTNDERTNGTPEKSSIMNIINRVMYGAGVQMMVGGIFDPENVRMIYPTIRRDQRILIIMVGLVASLPYLYCVTVWSVHANLLIMYLKTVHTRLSTSLNRIASIITPEYKWVSHRQQRTLRKELMSYKGYLIMRVSYKEIIKTTLDVLFPGVLFLNSILLCFAVIKGRSHIESGLYAMICAFCVALFTFQFLFLGAISRFCEESEKFVRIREKLTKPRRLGKEWSALRKMSLGVGYFFEFTKNIIPYLNVIVHSAVTLLLSVGDFE